ncbi:outer membrane protein assembly factor BamB family protein [Streptomyces mirabilis]|uniref:outer membrane protein assembly factor BamB family protein n=1 Tax=Streptomyces mirabilis TaxID=68239 RepID=UPI003647F1C8
MGGHMPLHVTAGLGGNRGPCAAASPDGSRVYVGGGDGALHAVSPGGRKLWATNLREQVMSPLATADGVYCLVQGEGDGASKLCALAPDGTVRWSEPIDGGASQFLVPAGELVLVTTGDTAKGTVRAYAPDGAVRWETKTLTGPSSEPVVSGGVAYIGTSELEALDIKRGHRLWSTSFDGGGAGRPAPLGGMVVVEGGARGADLHGVSLGGKKQWNTDNNDTRGDDYRLIPFGTVALSMSATLQRITALKSQDGSTAWTFRGDDETPAYSDPVVVGSRAYVCLGLALYVIGTDGKRRQKVYFGDPQDQHTHSPVVRGNRVYVATAKGIAAIDLPS